MNPPTADAPGHRESHFGRAVDRRRNARGGWWFRLLLPALGVALAASHLAQLKRDEDAAGKPDAPPLSGASPVPGHAAAHP